MKIAEEGNLEILNNKIGKYLPNRIKLESIDGANKIRIKHLLQMRTGLIDYLGTDQFEKLQQTNPYYPLRAIEATSFIYNSKLKFQPGVRYNYSNTNYVILGAIISKLSNKSLWRSLQEDITIPLNLIETKIERPLTYTVGTELTTRGHEKIKGQLKDVTKINDGLGLGDGGVISNAKEVDRFIRKLFFDQTILSPDSLLKMLNFKNSYGFGVEKEETLWGLAYQHNGTSSGYQGQYYFFPESGISWVLLTNSLDTDIIEDFFSTSMNKIYEYLN
jgi:D-alanyl-D-alanine carboxypeptidase